MSDLVGGFIVIAAAVLYFRFRRSRTIKRSSSRTPLRRVEKRVPPREAPPPKATTDSRKRLDGTPRHPPVSPARNDPPAQPSDDAEPGPDNTARAGPVPDQQSAAVRTAEPTFTSTTESPHHPNLHQPSTHMTCEDSEAMPEDASPEPTEAKMTEGHERRPEAPLDAFIQADRDTAMAQRNETGVPPVGGDARQPTRPEDRTGGRHEHDVRPTGNASQDEPAGSNANHESNSLEARRNNLPSTLHLATWLASGNWVIGAAIDKDNRSRPIRGLDEPITIIDPDSNEQLTLAAAKDLLGDRDPTIIAFALDQDIGRLSRTLRIGGNLILVPSGHPLPLAQHLTDTAPIVPSPLDGYEAYEVYVEFEIALPQGGQADTAVLPPVRSVPGFALHGSVVWPKVGKAGPTFSEPPIVAADDWSAVATLVVGEEAVGPRGWRKSLAINEAGASTNLVAHLHGFEAGWFFVRAYDALDRLIDSTQFQFIRGVRRIAVSEDGTGSRHVGAVHVTFDHDGGVDIDASAVGDAARAPSPKADASVWKLQFVPEQDVARFKLTRGGRKVQIDVPNEQVWWSRNAGPADSPVWTQELVNLQSADVTNARSTAQLVVLPPPTVKSSALRLVSQRGNGQTWRFARVPSEDHVALWLRELGNAVTPGQPVDIDLELHVDSDDAGTWGPVKIGTLSVQFTCTYCGHRTERVEAMATHLHQEHWSKLVWEPDLVALQRHFPDARIPRRILRCPHGRHDGCSGYFVANYFDGDKSDEVYFEHLRHVHPNREHSIFVVLDLDEIREEYLQGLPRLIECKKCSSASGVPFATEISDKGTHTMMRHLIERHRDKLWTLR